MTSSPVSRDGAVAAADRWRDDVPVDGLGDVGGLVPNGVGDVLDRDAVVAHGRHGGVAAFVRVPVPDPSSPGHLAEPPVECVPGVHGPVLMAEHEVIVVIRPAGGFAFDGLAPLVCVQGEDGERRRGEGALVFRARSPAWQEAGSGTGGEHMYRTVPRDETSLRGVVSTSRRN